MADVLNTSTLEMRASVNEAQAPYNAPPWIIITRAQFDLWSTIPQQYRKWTGVAVEEMTGPEKNAVDLAALEASRDEIVQQLDQQEDILRAFAGILVDELNAQASRTNALLDAIDAAASLAALKTAVAPITNLPTRTLSQLRQAIRTKLGS
jgi:hypothetical protein